ncbi:hypothetical protein EYF80_041285 [Liparis tanakae]|uniref:Uncharacterized protein n=1 Tax=Liparis tanakae TaxID=230148 RepID=A0A4Z2G4K0_9TELE|nr:hypothetical protein EYF80_041285 [Liparis tanakae]
MTMQFPMIPRKQMMPKMTGRMALQWRAPSAARHKERETEQQLNIKLMHKRALSVSGDQAALRERLRRLREHLQLRRSQRTESSSALRSQ